MDSAKKQHLLNKQAEKYKTMHSAKKQDLLNKQAEKYKKQWMQRTIQFRGHVYFEAVRPEFIMTALNWLEANIFHNDIQTDCTNMSTELTSIMNDEEVDQTNSSPINSLQNNLEKKYL